MGEKLLNLSEQINEIVRNLKEGKLKESICKLKIIDEELNKTIKKTSS